MSDTHDDRWDAVDDYLVATIVPTEPLFEDILRRSDQAGLPAISVTPAQGKLLHLLALARSARYVLEIGTLGGYSTVWLGRGVQAGGTVVTLEYEPRHAEVARETFRRACLPCAIDLRVGRAIEILPTVAAERGPVFDLTFIDADKPSTPEYFDWAVRLSRPGALVVVDNVVRDGAVADAKSADASVRAMRRFLEQLARDRRVTATAIQTVGSKGYDGFVLARVQNPAG